MIMETVLNIFKEILQIRKVYVSEVQDTEVKTNKWDTNYLYEKTLFDV